MIDDDLVTNMFTPKKEFGWPSTQMYIDTTATSTNGMNGGYGWHRWERWCVGPDMDDGRLYTFKNGVSDGNTKQNANYSFNNPLAAANKKIKEDFLITDVVAGCELSEASKCKVHSLFLLKSFDLFIDRL